MFLFCLFWNVLLFNEGVNFIESDTNANYTAPIYSLQDETTLENHPKAKRKRNLRRNPDPNVEVLALSPEILMATNRFICEFCQKGFKRELNMHLHKRTHKVEYELKPGSLGEIRKKVYVCPEPTCKHHHPSRALGDLTGIKKHYSRKHGEKNWECEKCSKVYAVESDLKAHSKKCDTREYKCDCGTIFSSKDSFLVHENRCVFLGQENARITANTLIHPAKPPQVHYHPNQTQYLSPCFSFPPQPYHQEELFYSNPSPMWDPIASTPTPLSLESQNLANLDFLPSAQGHLSDSSLNPNVVSFGSQMVGHVGSSSTFGSEQLETWDFLGDGNMHNGTTSQANTGMNEMLNFPAMALYQHNLTNWEQGGETFGYGAGPSWK